MQKYRWYKSEWHSKMDKSMQVSGMGERLKATLQVSSILIG